MSTGSLILQHNRKRAWCHGERWGGLKTKVIGNNSLVADPSRLMYYIGQAVTWHFHYCALKRSLWLFSPLDTFYQLQPIWDPLASRILHTGSESMRQSQALCSAWRPETTNRISILPPWNYSWCLSWTQFSSSLLLLNTLHSERNLVCSNPNAQMAAFHQFLKQAFSYPTCRSARNIWDTLNHVELSMLCRHISIVG